MESKSHHETLMVRYLLGQLPPEDQVRLEERAFTDQDYMQNFLAVERDLIDEYARGELTGAERRQFETHFLVSPGRRQRLRFSKALAQIAPESAAAAETSRRTVLPSHANWWAPLLTWLRCRNPALVYSLAALLLVAVIAGLWLITGNTRRDTQVAQGNAAERGRGEAGASVSTGTGERGRNAEEKPTPQDGEGMESRQPAEQQQQIERNAVGARQPQSGREGRARAHKESPAPSQPVIASLILPPGTSRSSDNLPQLIIPRRARLAQLQVGLMPEDLFEVYHAKVRTAGGAEIWGRKNIRARATRGAGRALTLLLPADLLAAGRYELVLKGVTTQGKVEDVNYYNFSVMK